MGFERMTFEQVDTVTVVRLRDRRLVDGAQVGELDRALRRLTDELGYAHLLLDFGPIEALSVAALTALLGVQGHLQTRGGRLALCGLRPSAREAFALAGPACPLTIYASEKDALLASW